MSNDPIIDLAIKQRDRLMDCAKEFRIFGQMARTPSAKTLANAGAVACEDAAKMLEKLGVEVDRLRLAIQHFDHGHMDRFELRNVIKTWNGATRTEPPREDAT